jgi:hypothetical protein
VWFTASVWTVLLALVALAATFAFVFHRGDPEGAARLANAEIEVSLEPGEQVVSRVVVRQRLWWDYYRHTHGVLAATDRRLYYVGVPPGPILHRIVGPPEFVTQSFPFSRGLGVSRIRLFPWRDPGVRLVGATGSAGFVVARRDATRLEETLGVATRAQSALRAASDAERRASEAAAAAARRPIHHLVRRGEALEFIARRYGVAVDSLLKWNGLSGPRIQVGQRLLVRPGRDQ